MKKLEDYIRTIPDFPEPGIMFRDITTVFQDADGLKLAIDSMEDMIKDRRSGVPRLYLWRGARLQSP